MDWGKAEGLASPYLLTRSFVTSGKYFFIFSSFFDPKVHTEWYYHAWIPLWHQYDAEVVFIGLGLVLICGQCSFAYVIFLFPTPYQKQIYMDAHFWIWGKLLQTCVWSLQFTHVVYVVRNASSMWGWASWSWGSFPTQIILWFHMNSEVLPLLKGPSKF